MTLRRIFIIPQNHQLIISLPKGFHCKKRVWVTIDDISAEKEKRFDLIRKASKDPLYLADMEEVNKDFEYLDGEAL